MGSNLAYEYRTRTHLLIGDEDAADFLQSQFSNELRPFENGRCTYGLWLNVKGKVLADSYVLCEGGEQFRILSETSEAQALVETLNRHIIADDVEVAELDALDAFSLMGVTASGILQELGYTLPAVGAFTEHADVVVFNGRRSVEPSYEMIALTAAAAERVRAGLMVADVAFVAAQTVEVMRMRAGVPLVPVEIGPEDMPGEGGLESDAISFSKGCYLGQEVVARMHHVGKPQRALYLISGTGARPDCPLALYNRDSKKVGELRSAVPHELGWLGVGLLKSRLTAVGQCLSTAAGDVLVERNFRLSAGGVDV